MKRLVFTLAVCVACADQGPSGSGIAGSSHVAVYDLPATPEQQLDLLFIIDDTIAMGAYQDRLAELPARVEQAFLSIGDGLLDTHIAVATSDGQLRRSAAVGSSYMSIRTEFDLERITNFTGTLRETFGSLANVGASRMGASQPLESMQRVLEANADGFVRDHAFLGIVIISATDDASPSPPADYVQFAKGLKDDPTNVLVTGITLAPTPRLDEFFAAFPHRNVVVSLPDGDHALALEAFKPLIKTILPGTCWEASDVDPETPGPQYDCTFSVMIRGNERRLPPCTLPGDQFCWSLVSSGNECSYTDHEPLKPKVPPYHLWFFRPALHAECVVIK